MNVRKIALVYKKKKKRNELQKPIMQELQELKELLKKMHRNKLR